MKHHHLRSYGGPIFDLWCFHNNSCAREEGVKVITKTMLWWARNCGWTVNRGNTIFHEFSTESNSSWFGCDHFYAPRKSTPLRKYRKFYSSPYADWTLRVDALAKLEIIRITQDHDKKVVQSRDLPIFCMNIQTIRILKLCRE